jgi:protein-tyrosine phosphatase
MELDQLSQRIVTILREAAAEPALLMIDEPTTGLAEAEAGVLLAILERLAVFTPLLVVLQNQKHARRISSSVVLLAGGRVQAACGAEAFFNDPANPAVAQFLATGTCTPLPPDAAAKPAEPPAAPAFDPNSLAAIKDEIRSALASEIFPQEPAAAEAAPEPELELAPVEAPVADLPAAPEEPEVEELQPEEIGFEAPAPAESEFGETAPEAEQPMAEDLPPAMAEPEDILPETYADEATYAEAPLQEPQAVAEPVVLEPEPAEDDAAPVQESAAFTPDFAAEPAPVAEAAPESEPEFALEPAPETAPDTEADVPPPVAETYEPAPDADIYEPAPVAEVYEPEPEAEVSEAEPEAAFIEPAPEAPWADAPAAEAEPLPLEFAAPEETEDFSAPESLEAEPAPYTAGDEFLPEAQDDAWAAPDATPLTDEPEPAAAPEEVMEDLSPEPVADAYTAPVDEILETTEEPEAIAAEAPALVDEPAPEPETAGEPEIIEEPAAIEEPVAAELVDEVEIVTEEEDIIVAERVTGPIARGPASTGSVLIDMLSDDEDEEPESLDDLPPISLSAQMIQSVPLPPRAATLQSHDPQRHEDAAVTRYPGSSGPGPRGFVWIEDGRLAATPMPGFSAPMDTDLEMLKRAGITVLITLTEQDFPQEVLESHGLRNVHFPIADNKAPTTTDTDGLVNKMRDMLNHGEVLAVHCLAGLGRTGTVLAAYMVKEKGVSAQVALNQIRRFNRQFVQTDDQEDFLVEYEVQQEQTDLLNRAADSTKYLK